MADIVRVHNSSDTDFQGKYNSQPFVVPAGEDALIDREAAIIWFGDWTSRNIGTQEKSQFRRQEFDRIRGIYGAHFDDRYDDPRTPEPKTSDEKWAINRPSIEIYEQKDGGWAKVVTVIEDPKGDQLSLAGTPVQNINEVLASQQALIEKMQRDLEEAKASVLAPTDSPENAPQRGRKPIKPEAVREVAE